MEGLVARQGWSKDGEAIVPAAAADLDAIQQILSWKDADELWSLAHFVAVSRPGHALNISGLPQQDVSLLEVPALAISSTDCRSRVSRGFPVWYLVPDGVVQYITKHHLYRSSE